jgi:hypothetical protein
MVRAGRRRWRVALALALGAATLAPCAPAGGTPAAAPSPPPAGTASRPTPAAGAESGAPGQILDLSHWKLQLPVDGAGGTAGRPAEVLAPGLATYVQAPYFTVRGGGVQLRAPVNGVTTSGSRYPRSELREMANGGATLAAWSTDAGTHTMEVEQAITAVPATKRHVVAGQIHDGTDDVLTVRLEHPRLFVDHNGKPGGTLTPSYVLGTRFTVRIEASEGQIRVTYNGAATPADTLSRSGGGHYFKAGAYTQSNCTREVTCGADNYGEVLIYRLEVSHRP